MSVALAPTIWRQLVVQTAMQEHLHSQVMWPDWPVLTSPELAMSLSMLAPISGHSKPWQSDRLPTLLQASGSTQSRRIAAGCPTTCA